MADEKAAALEKEIGEAFDKETARIEQVLEKRSYVIRMYDRSTWVGVDMLNAISNDELGGKLSSEFCKSDIEGGTIAIHAVEADALLLLYDQDSYWGPEEEEGTEEEEDPDERVVGFAAFALLNRKSPHRNPGDTEKILYIDILCTSEMSREKKKRYGTVMMTAIERLAKKGGYDFVELDSLPTAIDFYKKLGYVQKEEGYYVMRKSVKTGGRKTRRRKTKRRMV